MQPTLAGGCPWATASNPRAESSQTRVELFLVRSCGVCEAILSWKLREVHGSSFNVAFLLEGGHGCSAGNCRAGNRRRTAVSTATTEKR